MLLLCTGTNVHVPWLYYETSISMTWKEYTCLCTLELMNEPCLYYETSETSISITWKVDVCLCTLELMNVPCLYYETFFSMTWKVYICFCILEPGSSKYSTGGPKDIWIYWFAGLSSREWLTQHFRSDVIEYIRNEFN